MPTLAQVRDGVDAVLADLWTNTIVPRQLAYAAAHGGRYFQGLVFPDPASLPTNPDDGNQTLGELEIARTIVAPAALANNKTFTISAQPPAGGWGAVLRIQDDNASITAGTLTIVGTADGQPRTLNVPLAGGTRDIFDRNHAWTAVSAVSCGALTGRGAGDGIAIYSVRNALLRPTDQAESWADVITDLGRLTLPCALALHTYCSPFGYGFVGQVWAQAAGTLWTRSQGYGPSAAEFTAAWAAVEPGA